VPILDGTRVLGAMQLRSRGRSCDAEDIALLEAVAALGATSLLVLARLEEVRVFDENARRGQAAHDMLQSIAICANEAMSIEEAGGAALAILCGTNGWAAGHLWLRTDDGAFRGTGVWHTSGTESWRGIPAKLDRDRGPLVGALTGLVTERGRLAVVAETREDPRFEGLSHAGTRGLWVLPVLVANRVEAVLACFSAQPLVRGRALDAVAPAIGQILGRVLERDRALDSVRMRAGLLESAGAAVIGSDADHRIVVWNRAAERLFGWSRGEALGRIDSELVRIRPDAEQTAEITARLTSGESWEGDYTLTRRGGELVPVHITAAPAVDARGRPIGFIGIITDLRRSRQRERQRRQTHTMDAVGRLAGGVAHDFNNLLTGIRGVAQLLLEDLAPDHPIRSDIEEIVGAANRAADLTARLLAFGRRQVLRPRIIDLAAWLEQADAGLRAAAGGALVTDVGRSARTRIDPAQLQRAVQDLVGHVHGYAGDRPVEVRTDLVTLDRSSARAMGMSRPGAWITIDVQTSGSGLPAEALDGIFEPFTTLSSHGGGLGLGTAYGIVRQSDGMLTASNADDGTTTLRVWLPVTDGPDEVAPPADRPVPSKSAQTLLLVEDEPTVRRLAHKILVRQGYHVLEAADGNEALAILDSIEDGVALVISDVVMPGMGGAELVRRLHMTHPDVPILLMSGYADDAVLRRAFADSGQAFIEKPFTPDALVRRVRGLLEGTGRRA
jgi:two-component system, cell cycle sensor histidine kinase and response regulator CckA